MPFKRKRTANTRWSERLSVKEKQFRQWGLTLKRNSCRSKQIRWWKNSADFATVSGAKGLVLGCFCAHGFLFLSIFVVFVGDR